MAFFLTEGQFLRKVAIPEGVKPEFFRTNLQRFGIVVTIYSIRYKKWANPDLHIKHISEPCAADNVLSVWSQLFAAGDIDEIAFSLFL